MPDFEPRYFYLVVSDMPLSLGYTTRPPHTPSKSRTALDALRDVALAENVNFTVSCLHPDDFRETWNATSEEAGKTCDYADAAHEAIQKVAEEGGK